MSDPWRVDATQDLSFIIGELNIGDTVNVYLQEPDSAGIPGEVTTVVGEIDDRETGACHISFTPTIKGTWKIDIDRLDSTGKVIAWAKGYLIVEVIGVLEKPAA